MNETANNKKKKLKTEDILLSAFTGVESAHAFSAFLPSIFTIQSLAVPQGQQAQIRMGYVPSVIFSLALGGIVGAIIKSWLPVAFGIGTSAFMVATYEIAMRSAPPAIQLIPEAMAKLSIIDDIGHRYRIVSE